MFIFSCGRFVYSSTDGSGELFQKEIAASNNKRGPFVYGFIDLFSGSGESWNWGFVMDEKSVMNSSVQPHPVGVAKLGYEVRQKEPDKSAKQLKMPDTKQEELVGNDTDDDKDQFILEGQTTEDDDGEFGSETSGPLPYASVGHDQESTVERDLIVVHLLRLACASGGPLADALPQITTELFNQGIISECARDLASKPSSTFNKTFDHVFQKHMVSSRMSQFWKPTADFGELSTSLPSSRFLNDFEELKSIGHGGFGHVVLCENKLDGRQYAVKKIRLKDKSLPVNDRILREVATLSRLQHQHVVRYYQAWFETGVTSSYGDTTGVSATAASSSFSHLATSSVDALGHENKLESTYLYIQMEYCPRTLRQVFESYHFEKESAWHLFRQIVEGLAHIHGQGIIHRDLTPNNIFFDARNDIKIGDFGLGKI
ncbi:hypothetical protein SLA2020_265560 [Shorea laevis]